MGILKGCWGEFKMNILSRIVENIQDTLNKIGLLYRIYYRSKGDVSIVKKIEKAKKDGDPYNDTKKMQDLFSIRIVLYFSDDVKIVHQVLSSIFNERKEDSETHDLQGESFKDTFKPVRYNVIYDIPAEYGFSISSVIADENLQGMIDSTFEVQIRTTLSEGWYEVEHDLRYKNKDDWRSHDEEWRQLNGVLASLETNDWAMIQIFNSLAYKHYRNRNWRAMLNLKLRIRVDSKKELSPKIIELFNKDNDLGKKFFKSNREKIIMKMNECGFYYPLTLDNIVYFINIISESPNEELLAMTPSLMKEEMNQ